MSMYPPHLRRLIDDTLSDYEPYAKEGFRTPSAVNLLMGTAAVESAAGKYLWQLKGPAVGVFQMEPATFNWLRVKFMEEFTPLQYRSAEHMAWDLRLAVLMARLRYRVDPSPLPDASDIDGLAAYYKRVFNTVAGEATVEGFKNAYKLYVEE